MEEEKADDGAHSAAHIYGLPADSEFANEWYGIDDTGKDNAGKRDDDWEPSGSDSEDDSEDSLAPVKAAGGKLRALGGRGKTSATRARSSRTGTSTARAAPRRSRDSSVAPDGRAPVAMTSHETTTQTPPPRPQLGHVPGDNWRGGVRPGRNFELSLLVRAAHVHTSDHDTLYN